MKAIGSAGIVSSRKDGDQRQISALDDKTAARPRPMPPMPRIAIFIYAFT
jgi:hypothetical protein